MHAIQIVALPPMTGGTSLCRFVLLLVNKFHYWLPGSKNTPHLVKPSYVVQENEYVVKTLIFYVKYKLICHKTLSCPLFSYYMCVHLCIMNLHVHSMCVFIFMFSL